MLKSITCTYWVTPHENLRPCLDISSLDPMTLMTTVAELKAVWTS